MKLEKKPIASAVALALLSAVYPVYAQQSGTPVAGDRKIKQAPDATPGKTTKDKASDQAKPSPGTGEAATENGKPDGSRDNIILAQAAPPPAADFAAIGGDGGVVGHVLWLERGHREAAIGQGAAETGDEERFADIGAGAHEHQ